MWASPGLLGPVSPPQRPAQRGSETLCRQGADSCCPRFHLPRGQSSTFSLGGSFQQVPFSRLKSRFHVTTEIPGPVLGTLQALLQSGVQPQPWGPQHRRSPGPRGQASGEVSGPAGEGRPAGGQCQAGHRAGAPIFRRHRLSPWHEWGAPFMPCTQLGFYLEAQKLQLFLGQL